MWWAGDSGVGVAKPIRGGPRVRRDICLGDWIRVHRCLILNFHKTTLKKFPPWWRERVIPPVDLVRDNTVRKVKLKALFAEKKRRKFRRLGLQRWKPAKLKQRQTYINNVFDLKWSSAAEKDTFSFLRPLCTWCAENLWSKFAWAFSHADVIAHGYGFTFASIEQVQVLESKHRISPCLPLVSLIRGPFI